MIVGWKEEEWAQKTEPEFNRRSVRPRPSQERFPDPGHQVLSIMNRLGEIESPRCNPFFPGKNPSRVPFMDIENCRDVIHSRIQATQIVGNA